MPSDVSNSGNNNKSNSGNAKPVSGERKEIKHSAVRNPVPGSDKKKGK